MAASDSAHAIFVPPDRPLNITDAVSYLDSVKMVLPPDAYRHFLDIMGDFRHERIDTQSVIGRISNLFHGYPDLVPGFNAFLPAGYHIECTTDAHGANLMTITTPEGTRIQSAGSSFM